MVLRQKIAWLPHHLTPDLQSKLGAPNTKSPCRALKIFHPPGIGYEKKNSPPSSIWGW